jgi:uncharacterized membrane protein
MDWLILSLLTAALVAGATLLEKRGLVREHSMEFTAALALFSVFATIPLWPRTNWEQIIGPSIFPIFLASAINAAAFFFLAKGIRHLPISTTTPLLSLQPLLVAIFAVIFISEKITALHFAGILVLVIGAYIVEVQKGDSPGRPFARIAKNTNYLYMLAALVLFTIASIFDKIILSWYHVEPMTYITATHAFIALIFLGILSASSDGVKKVSHAMKNAGVYVLLCAVLVVGYRTAQSFALVQADVSIVTAIKRTSVIFVTLFGGNLFHEGNILQKTLGTIIMIIGTVMLIL